MRIFTAFSSDALDALAPLHDGFTTATSTLRKERFGQIKGSISAWFDVQNLVVGEEIFDMGRYSSRGFYTWTLLESSMRIRSTVCLLLVYEDLLFCQRRTVWILLRGGNISCALHDPASSCTDRDTVSCELKPIRGEIGNASGVTCLHLRLKLCALDIALTAPSSLYGAWESKARAHSQTLGVVHVTTEREHLHFQSMAPFHEEGTSYSLGWPRYDTILSQSRRIMSVRRQG